MIMITLEWIYYSFVLAINTDVDFDWRHILMFKSKSMQVEENCYFIVKRLKKSFLICLRRPFLCQFHVAKALQNI